MKGFFILFFSTVAGLTGHLAAESKESSPDLTELRKLAEKGDSKAQLTLGMRYRDGDGIPRDYEKALKWYRRSADTGNAAGMDNVGFMHLKGWGVPVDFNIAAAYFKAAAAENDGQALYNLGNCYFSGQGVEQDYEMAIDSWKRASSRGSRNAIWRLATLQAAGEGLKQDWDKAQKLCESVADKGVSNAALLLGELYSRQGEEEKARHWWEKAAKQGNTQAKTLIQLSKWRHQDPVAGSRSYVEVDHLYQGWNNCGSTSIAMFARHAGIKTSPYDVKRMCPQSPIGTGTDWEDLLTAGKKLGQQWKMPIFTNDDAGFSKGLKFIQSHLDAKRPVVIDFTVTRNRDGEIQHFGHTLLVVGYNKELDQYVLKNPNQPPPGIQFMSAQELKENWYSKGYSRLAKGQAARPLIVREGS